MINGMKAVLQQLFAQAEQIADSRTTQPIDDTPGKRGLNVVLDSRCCTSPVPSLAACTARPNLQAMLLAESQDMFSC